MARNYTVEDVESLRSKGGVSYEEAIRLLDKYDGDIASALIELEKSGNLGKTAVNADKISELAAKWWNLGLKNHVLIERKETMLVNLPVVVALLLAVCAPRATLVAAVLLLIFGGRISLQSPGQAQEPQSEPPQSEPPQSDKKDEAAEAKGETPAEEKPSDGFDRITIE